MQVTIVDYGSGNIHSIKKAVESVSGQTKVIVSNDRKEIEKASHIILPGVGAFADCLKGLSKTAGLKETLCYEVQENKKFFLGICVGMQMLATVGHENGEYAGLDWIKGSVRPIDSFEGRFKVPHMGWNELKIVKKHSLFKGVCDGNHVYFVHSYHFKCEDTDDIIAQTSYGEALTAAVARGNIMAVQFHPEKSQLVGLKILSNFLEM